MKKNRFLGLVMLALALSLTGCPDPTTNKAPTAAAGSNININGWNATTATLDGRASSDPDGTISAYEWSQKSGPVTTTLIPRDGVPGVTDVSGLTAVGAYVYQLKVTDNAGAVGTDEVIINVTKPTQNVTKDVSVEAISFVAEATLDFTPAFTPAGGWGDFQASDITYTLTDDMGHTNADFPGGVVAASLYSDSDLPVVTQTFYYNGDPVVNRGVVLEITDPGGFPLIVCIYDNKTSYNILSEVPAVNLGTLSKQVPVTE
jgi:hypothetical protein